jgi:hypothetical protein
MGGAKEFICSACYRAFVLPAKTSWLSGERAPCPFCKSRDTSPMLSIKVDGRRLDTYTFKRPDEIRETRERLIVEARS